MEPTENLVGLIFCAFSNLFVKKVVQDLTSGGLLGVWGKWMKHAKYILDNDFHPIEAETRNKLLRDENGGDSNLVPSREIKIGRNCFIGCNSIILKGTVLGDGCVVGAGAVVAGKFENNCVIAGNPARVIKRLEGKA